MAAIHKILMDPVGTNRPLRKGKSAVQKTLQDMDFGNMVMITRNEKFCPSFQNYFRSDIFSVDNT